jgi:hypothetical protein
MNSGRVPPNRTQGAVRKKQYRDARKAERERNTLISAEDWLQPPITPESFNTLQQLIKFQPPAHLPQIDKLQLKTISMNWPNGWLIWLIWLNT